MKCQEHREKEDEECLICTQRALDVALLQVRAMQEIVDAAMNENMPRIRAATKAYQEKQRTEKRKCGLSKPMGIGETCTLEADHRGPCDHAQRQNCLCAAKADIRDIVVCPVHG